MEVKQWTQSTNTVEITYGQEESKQNIHVNTEGSKSEHWVWSETAIFKQQINRQEKKLNGWYSNNQAENLAILKH